MTESDRALNSRADRISPNSIAAMTVKELIEALQKVDDKTYTVVIRRYIDTYPIEAITSNPITGTTMLEADTSDEETQREPVIEM